MEQELEVYFCDLCNTSVPQRELETGGALRTKSGKVIGPCCMEEIRPPEPRPSSSSRGVAALGVVILAAVAGSTVFLDWRLSEELDGLRGNTTRIQGALREQDQRLAALEARLDGLAHAAGLEEVATRLEALESRLSETRETVETSLGNVSTTVENLASRLGGVPGGIARLGEGLEKVVREVRGLDEEIAALRAMPRAESKAAGAPPAAAPALPAGAATPERGGVPPELAHHVARLSDPDPGTRFEAVDRLIQSKAPQVRDALLNMLEDADPFVRRLTAEGLRHFKHPATIEALLTALSDPEGIVRHAAYVSLQELTGQRIHFDADADREARAAAVRRWKEWWRKNKGRF